MAHYELAYLIKKNIPRSKKANDLDEAGRQKNPLYIEEPFRGPTNK